MSDLLQAVDAIYIPLKKFVERIRGPVKNVPPPDSRKLENRARMWMIAPHWLADPVNAPYLGRILISGRAWGDDENPGDLAKKRAEIAELKREAEKRKKGNSGLPSIRIMPRNHVAQSSSSDAAE